MQKLSFLIVENCEKSRLFFLLVLLNKMSTTTAISVSAFQKIANINQSIIPTKCLNEMDITVSGSFHIIQMSYKYFQNYIILSYMQIISLI